LGPHEALAYSWRKFCSLVKHESRYFFTRNVRHSDNRELLSPSELLRSIVDYARNNGLVRTLPAGQEYFRARLQDAGRVLARPHELGPPPPKKAAQNRMSPAGIVMTYVSEDKLTALMLSAPMRSENSGCAGTSGSWIWRRYRPCQAYSTNCRIRSNTIRAGT